jgi:hypothetical protein
MAIAHPDQPMQTVLIPQWQPYEVMPGDISYVLEYPEHQLYASVSPLSMREDRVPYAYTYAVIKREADGSDTRIKHWLESGKKHKVSLDEGKRLCEDAIAAYLA